MRKLFKGILGLFIFNAFLVLSSSGLQSCDNELEGNNSEEISAAFMAFKAAMKEEEKIYRSKLSKIQIEKNKQNRLSPSSNDVPIDFIDDNPTPEEQLAIDFEEGIRDEAKMVLYAYDFTDNKIIEEFGSVDSPDISVVANLVMALEEELQQDKRIDFMQESDFELASILGVSSLYAQQTQTEQDQLDTVGGCIADAIGITAVFEILSNGANKRMKKAAIRKVIRKVATRTLGVVGAALAVYDFVDCMDWI